MSLFSLTIKYQSNSVTHFFFTVHLHQVLRRKLGAEIEIKTIRILFFETLQLQYCKQTNIFSIISLFIIDNTCIFQSNLYLQSSLFLWKQLTLKENFSNWFRKNNFQDDEVWTFAKSSLIYKNSRFTVVMIYFHVDQPKFLHSNSSIHVE